MRIVFMGTPEIAQVALSALLSDRHQIVGVFTREDKPVGRKQIMTAPPVKRRAQENSIPVFQPKTLKDPEVVEQIKELQPDLIVVVAYGRILPAEVLTIPPLGCVNMHVSLLPKYRGAAPIQWAVINGERNTGVTIMQMDEGLDTGPIIAQQKVGITQDATSGEVFELVSGIGARLLNDTIHSIAKGEARSVPQGEGATYAPPLNKEMAKMDFTKPAKELHNLVCGCNPWPLAWFTYKGKRIKVTRSKLVDGTGIPGDIVRLSPLTICCGDSFLSLEYVLPEGSKAMTGAEWASGRRFKAGDSIFEATEPNKK